MRSDDIIKAAAFVMRGKNKKAVFLALGEPKMPRDIMLEVFGAKSESYFSIVSRALSELQDAGLIEIINPDDKTGRMYRLTKQGDEVARFLQRERKVKTLLLNK